MARSKSQTESADLVTAAVANAAAAWAVNTRVCVALSGGSDSVVLLHALAALRTDGWSLSAHHVHHGLSANADAWAAHCESFCASLAVPLTVERVTVDQRTGTGLESAARDARITSLDRVAADVIVLAHHAMDQAETLLLQLLRGSGPAGMAAMPAAAGRYLRPLLGVPKSALSSYGQLHQLQWVEDESNSDNRFSRNRLRNAVWPVLVDAFPAAETTLVRAAQLQAEVSELIDDLAKIDAAICVDENALVLQRFNALNAPRRANLLRFWLLENNIGPLASDTLREWLKQLASIAAIQAIELRGGKYEGAIRVFRGRAHVVAELRHWLPCRWTGEALLTLQSGERTAGQIEFLPAATADSPRAFRAPHRGESWLVRSRLEGDGVALSERSGHVALKNIFQQANIPPWLRGTWPLLTCDDEIVAVVGIATAKAFNVTPGQTGMVCEWKPA
jgi:tRNA(Ile)-lysidine synthase